MNLKRILEKERNLKTGVVTAYFVNYLGFEGWEDIAG